MYNIDYPYFLLKTADFGGSIMRTLLLSIVSFFLLACNCYAQTPVSEPQAMVYYQIPLGGNNTQQKKHAFGFRMDRTISTDGSSIKYQDLIKKPALVDFKMGYDGVRSLNIAGVDYLRISTVQHANGDEDEDSVQTGTDEESIVAEKLRSIPIGAYAGIILGIGLLLGAGG